MVEVFQKMPKTEILSCRFFKLPASKLSLRENLWDLPLEQIEKVIKRVFFPTIEIAEELLSSSS